MPTIEAETGRATAAAPRPSAPAPGSAAAATRGVVAIVVAFVGLSLGSTMAKSTGSPGAVVACWRFLVAAVLWHGIVAVRGARTGARRTVDGRAWRAAALPGVAFGVNLACFFSGVARTPIAHAEFISAMAPLVLVPVAAVTLHERVERSVLALGGVALAGVALILSRSSAAGTSYSGDLLVVGAVACWAVYLVLAKAARAQLDTPAFMAVMSTTASATTLVIALATEGAGALVGLSGTAWVLVALLALTSGTISHGLITWAQDRVQVGMISILQLAQPGLGVLWAATFLDESVAPVQLVGMAVVLGAVGTIARRSGRRRPAPSISPRRPRRVRSRARGRGRSGGTGGGTSRPSGPRPHRCRWPRTLRSGARRRPRRTPRPRRSRGCP
jgi:drug/metabolite transporter (DMT)-like permease